MYGNGPGFKKVNGSRPDIRDVDTSKALGPKSEHQQSAMSVCAPPLQAGIKMFQNGDNEKTIPNTTTKKQLP